MSGASTGAANRERIVRDSSYIEDTRLFLGHWNVILRYRICSKRWWVPEGHCILRERGREKGTTKGPRILSDPTRKLYEVKPAAIGPVFYRKCMIGLQKLALPSEPVDVSMRSSSRPEVVPRRSRSNSGGISGQVDVSEVERRHVRSEQQHFDNC